jgi:short-subunit dehydrogenase
MARFKVAVITGASAGIGRAAALAFARHGADVALLSRNKDRLESLRAEIEALSRRAIAIPLDVADAEAVEAAATRTEQSLGPIDFRRVTEVTYLGAVHGTLAALRRMRPRERGSIVLVGSALAYRGIPLQSAYCAAKHALQGFNDSLQAELLHERSRVRLSMVQLSAVNTFDWARSRLTRKARPVPPVFPELAAQAILWAAAGAR